MLRFISYCAKEIRLRSNPIAARELSTHLAEYQWAGNGPWSVETSQEKESCQ
jgi:hypothetical protein